MKKSLRKVVEGLLWIWSQLDDWSKFMPSTDPISFVIKWVSFVLGKIGESVRVSYYRSLYATKETYELLSPATKDPYGKDRREKSLSNLKKRTAITVAKAKLKAGLKLTKEETELLKQIE